MEDVMVTKKIRINILQAKIMSTDEDMRKEMDLKLKIGTVSPVEFSASMKVEELKIAVMKSLSLLKEFYDIKEAKDHAYIWSTIRNTLSIPNVFIFQAILEQVDKESEVLNQFESKIGAAASVPQIVPKLQQQLLVSGIKLIECKSQLYRNKSACGEKVQDFTNELDKNLNSSIEYSFQYEEDDDTVGDYISIQLKHWILQGKLEHVSAFLTQLKENSKMKLDKPREYTTIVQDTQKIYELIEIHMLEAQQNIAYIYQINEKLNFGKISMVHLIQDLKTTCKHQALNRHLMISPTMSPTFVKQVPPHFKEVSSFLECSINQFNSSSPGVRFELQKNHFLANEDEIAELFKQLNVDVENTPKNILLSMKEELKGRHSFLSISQNLKSSSFCLKQFSISELRTQCEKNRSSIIETLDKISKINNQTKYLLSDTNSLYKYFLINPLRKFVPPSQKFEGKSFKEYESDFNLYYRMLKN